MSEPLFDESKVLVDSILEEPTSIGKKLIEIADNLRSLAKVKNDDEIEFCSILIKRCGIDINTARYSMLTEIMGIKVKSISKEDVSDVIANIKGLIENLEKEKNNRDYNKIFELGDYARLATKSVT